MEEIKIGSLCNLGCCYIDIGDNENAIDILDKFRLESEEIALSRHTVESYFLLAFLNSNLNLREETYRFIERFNSKITAIKEDSWTEGYSYFFIAMTYKNLGDIEKSHQIYQQAIYFAKESSYRQIQAKALTGLAELYRIQNDIETALTHHQQSIEILDKIGAKCDLAEAYFQLALTYQQKGDQQANAQEYFNKAIYLWSPEQIDAPKQIERVKKAMNCEH